MLASVRSASVILLVTLVVSVSPRWALASDPDLTTDFGINVTSGDDLTFTGFRDIPDPPSGEINVVSSFVDNFPALKGLGLSGSFLKFGPNSMITLHNHPRGNEMVFLLSGSIDVGVVDTQNRLLTATLTEVGDTCVIPKGFLHFGINRSQTNSATVITVFNSDNAGRVTLAPALFNTEPRLPSDILERALNLDATTVATLGNFTFPIVGPAH